MKLAHLSLTVAAIALGAPLHAQTCSGGTDGGMDATGNQCNAPLQRIEPLRDRDDARIETGRMLTSAPVSAASVVAAPSAGRTVAKSAPTGASVVHRTRKADRQPGAPRG